MADASSRSRKAWTYVGPRRQGEEARCWLKSRVPAQTQSNCCTTSIERGDIAPAKSSDTKSNDTKSN